MADADEKTSPGVDGRDERNASTTLDELRDLVTDLSSSMKDGFATVMGQNADNAGAIASLRDDIVPRMKRVERELWGSKGPPPLVTYANDSGSGAPSLAKKTEANESEIDELRGIVVAQGAKIDAVLALNRQQSRDASGVDVKIGEDGPEKVRAVSSFTAFLRTASVKDVVKVLTLVAAIIAAISALSRGPAPAPAVERGQQQAGGSHP